MAADIQAELGGTAPSLIPLMLPPHPAHARIRTRMQGYAGGGELVLTSEEFWAAPKSTEPGTVYPFVAEHTFVLSAGGADLMLTCSPLDAAAPVGGVFSMFLGVTNLGPSNA